ncbi:S41 family peptidase [Mycoplasmatota bacterium WC30]
MKNIYKLILMSFLIFGFLGCGEEVSTTTATTAVTTEVTSAVTTVAITTTEAITETTVVTTVDLDPVFDGVQDVSVLKGDSDFELLSGITVTDNEDGNLFSSINVDGAVSIDVAGEYPITLTVTDSAGNEVTVSFTVTVELSEDEANALLDAEAIVLDVNDLVLPSVGENGSRFYWITDRPDVITKKGYIIPPGIGSGPVTVTLTTKVINGSFSQYFDFELIVQPNEELTGEISMRSVPFEGTSEEYVVADQTDVPLYFVDNGNVPYIDVETFLYLIEGAIEPTMISFTPVGTDGLLLEYSVDYEDFDGSTVTETYSGYLDFTLNTFTVNTFSFFGSYIASTTSDYGEGLNYVDADYGEPNEVTIPLGFYNIDLLMYDDGANMNYLMPFHVADLLFAGDVYYDVYYNGDKLWGIDTFGLSGGEPEDLALQDQIRVSSYNSEDIPEDLRWATYNFLGLAMDYFYGLRETYEVDTYFEILSAQAELMIEPMNDVDFYSEVFYTAYNLDDLHTSHIFTGYYEEPYNMQVYLNDLGSKTVSFYEGLWAMQDLLDLKYGSYENLPDDTLLDGGKTAVFYITGFDIDSPDRFKEFLQTLPAHTENVVIDLSYNTGGNVGAVLRMFGYMTEETIMYHSYNPADGSTSTYYIESDYVAYDFDYYIVSSSVSFSAANLMISMAKEQGIATILGKDSSGGASSIGVILTPDGSALMISTNNVLATRVGDEISGYEYLSVEDGIEVDYFMYNVTSDDLIVSLIETAKAEAE